MVSQMRMRGSCALCSGHKEEGEDDVLGTQDGQYLAATNKKHVLHFFFFWGGELVKKK